MSGARAKQLSITNLERNESALIEKADKLRKKSGELGKTALSAMKSKENQRNEKMTIQKWVKLTLVRVP